MRVGARAVLRSSRPPTVLGFVFHALQEAREGVPVVKHQVPHAQEGHLHDGSGSGGGGGLEPGSLHEGSVDGCSSSLQVP